LIRDAALGGAGGGDSGGGGTGSACGSSVAEGHCSKQVTECRVYRADNVSREMTMVLIGV
jgi:hypothetical protein